MISANLMWLLMCVVLGFGLYAIVLRQLAKAVQPLRLRLAEEGEALLAEGILSIEEESDVRMFLDNAYNGWMAVYVMLLMPAAMFYLTINSPGTDGRATDRLTWLFLVSVLAANPFMGALAAMEFVVLAFGVVIATGSFAMLRAALRRVFHNLAARHEAHATN